MKHAHAALLHRLADDCELAVWVWVEIRKEWWKSEPSFFFSTSGPTSHIALGDKPTSPPKRYAMVEGLRVPMTHLTVAPEGETKVWFIDANNQVWSELWLDTSGDRCKLAALNCYTTEADATEAAAAWAQVRKIAAENAK